MKDVPDTPLRLYLRVTLKSMIALAAVGALVVATRFLAGGAGEGTGRARFDVSGLPVGRVLTVGWDGRPVIVLHRRAATVEALGGAVADDASPAWYVAWAAGTATGCTIVWQPRARRFRESCSAASWDAAGRPLPGTEAGPLQSPPHRLTADQRLILGEAGG